MATRELKAAALAVAAAVSSAANHNTIACEAVAAVVVAVAADSDILGRNVPRKPNGRYLRTNLPTPGNSFWRELLAHGDEMAFFNFTALLRGSFVDLVELCKDDLLSMPIRGHTGDATHHSPRRCHQRRRLFTPADIISMTLKFLTTTAELKDLHPQFGALKTTYNDCVWLGMQDLGQSNTLRSTLSSDSECNSECEELGGVDAPTTTKAGQRQKASKASRNIQLSVEDDDEESDCVDE